VLLPGPRGLSRDFVKAHQRTRLIDGMVAAVDAKGYAATTVANVLSRARVSRSAFYEQFRDKEDCFLACYDSGTSLVLEAVTSGFGQGGSWRERMRRVYQSVLETFAQHPQLARVCMVEALAAGPAANKRYQSAIAGLASLAENDMIAHGDVPPVPRLVFTSLIGGASTIIYQEILAGRTVELPALADDLTRLWVAELLGYGQADDPSSVTRNSSRVDDRRPSQD
jgi:AcrR family transcriptional regulator